MIRKLRRRMTLLVAAVLVLVTAGIVMSINYMNWRNIRLDAAAALKTLSENSGARPPLHGEDEPPAAPENESEAQEGGLPGPSPQGPPEKPSDRDGRPGQPPQSENALAALSNYYVVTLSKDDSIESWTSDREDLYSDLMRQ